jgi:hypothetical protein
MRPELDTAPAKPRSSARAEHTGAAAPAEGVPMTTPNAAELLDVLRIVRVDVAMRARAIAREHGSCSQQYAAALSRLQKVDRLLRPAAGDVETRRG